MGYRIVYMDRELFSMLMTEGHRIPARAGQQVRIVKGLPPGARLEGVQDFFLTNQIVLKYSHPSWEPVPEGHALPVQPVVYVTEDDLPDAASDLTPMEEIAKRRAGG